MTGRRAAEPRCRAVGHGGQRRGRAASAPPGLLDAAERLLGLARRDDVAGTAAGGRPAVPGGDVRRAGAGPRRCWPLAGGAADRGRDRADGGRRALAAAGPGARGGRVRPPGGHALRRSQELQRGFLSRLSHELRTPLTAIRGYASSLLQPDVTWDGESQQRFLARIAAESARLGRLVDDLLDFSAIESGILRLQRDWCDLAAGARRGRRLPAARRGAAMIEVDCDPALPVVWADHDRLEQVFVNLLDNALGHNPPGTRVRDQRGRRRPGGTVAVSVADDGAGMPRRDRQRAVRARCAAAGRPTAGAGLGLSIARGIVEAHGGQHRAGASRRRAPASGSGCRSRPGCAGDRGQQAGRSLPEPQPGSGDRSARCLRARPRHARWWSRTTPTSST